jgi:ribosome biogenesis GTPase
VASRAARERGLPAVGDWVALLNREPVPAIHAVVDRRTAFSRKVAGIESKEQVLAANVDLAFVVASAEDVDSRRIERYLAMAWQSGASPVIVLTKADLVSSLDETLVELESAAAGTPVLATSSITGEGVDAISSQLRPTRTGVLLGPSGVGKSTLINRMVGAEVMKTKAVYRTGEGRHMTSHRQLVELPGGGMIIDTPGLREAQLASCARWPRAATLASPLKTVASGSRSRLRTAPGIAICGGETDHHDEALVKPAAIGCFG